MQFHRVTAIKPASENMCTFSLFPGLRASSLRFCFNGKKVTFDFERQCSDRTWRIKADLYCIQLYCQFPLHSRRCRIPPRPNRNILIIMSNKLLKMHLVVTFLDFSITERKYVQPSQSQVLRKLTLMFSEKRNTVLWCRAKKCHSCDRCFQNR